MKELPMERSTPPWRAVLVGAASTALTVAFVACSDSTSPGSTGASQIAFTTSTGAVADAVPVTNGGHTLDVTGVSLTISRAELKASKSNSCPGDDDEDDDANDDHPKNVSSTAQCGELKIGPTTVALPLGAGMATIPANAIPAGTYREFEIRVTQAELVGTFDSKAFDVTVPVRTKTEIEFSTPLVVTADQATQLTVNVPINNWLVNTDGSLIDPSKIATTPSLLSQIKLRIMRSFRAFEDRDHDGHEDHGRDGN
jgi:hypothetical protein